MKFRVDVDGVEYALDLKLNGGTVDYRINGASGSTGTASLEHVGEDQYSVLLNERSFRVHVVRTQGQVEVWTGNIRRRVSVTDTRDQAGSSSLAGAGTLEVRARMPGKVVKRLVEPGAQVKAGDGLIVLEAMKMQNEIKAPRDGVVLKIHAAEGATVAAGESLLAIE